MAQEVLESSTTTQVHLYADVHAPDSTPTAAAVVVYDSGGASIASGSATVDPVDVTISSATDAQTVVLSSASAVVVGRRYRLSNATGSVGVVTAETVNTSTGAVTFAEPPGFTPGAGDAFKGFRVSYTLPAAATKDRGVNYSILWSVTQAGIVSTYRTVFHVCRTLFRDQITPSKIYRYVADNHPSAAAAMTGQRRQALADRSNDLIRARLLQTQRYPHLVADVDSFSEAAHVAMQYVLMDERLMLPGDEGLLASMGDLERRLDQEITRAIDSMVWVDTDDDNAVSASELAPVSIRMVF